MHLHFVHIPFLLLFLHFAAASPLPTSTLYLSPTQSTTSISILAPTPYIYALPLPLPLLVRNHAGPLSPLNYSGTLAPHSTSATDSPLPASVTQAGNTTSSTSEPFFGTSIPSQLLNYVALVIVVAVVLALAIARYVYVKRFYPPTIRSYFLPPAGIHVNFLHIHIKAPPPRPVLPLPGYLMTPSTRTRRTRRERETRGADIGQGGVRAGARDQDDHCEGDDSLADDTDLPKYAVDVELPAYLNEHAPSQESSQSAFPIGRSDAAMELSSPTEPHSVQSYEAFTRLGSTRPTAPDSVSYTGMGPPTLPVNTASTATS